MVVALRGAESRSSYAQNDNQKNKSKDNNRED
jgi:hypothetical protein